MQGPRRAQGWHTVEEQSGTPQWDHLRASVGMTLEATPRALLRTLSVPKGVQTLPHAVSPQDPIPLFRLRPLRIRLGQGQKPLQEGRAVGSLSPEDT